MRRIFALLAIPGLACSASISNTIDGLGPNGQVKPWICVQNKNGKVTLKLPPGKSGDANMASGNNYYAGATLRFDGCDVNNTYLGYLDIHIEDGISKGYNSIKYTPPKGVHIEYADPSIDTQGIIRGQIRYTAIHPNPNLPSPQSAGHWQFSGINLSGLEFGRVIDPVVIPNLSEEDSVSANSDLKDTESFIQSGMNTIRLPLSWGYLQLEGPGKGPINKGYYDNYVKPALQSLTKAKINTIVDLHAYMRYSKFGEQYSGCFPGHPCPDGELILDEQAYQSVWRQLAELILNDQSIDKDYILFDLMNEPVGVPNDKVFTIQVSLIKMLREELHFSGYILVEGNNWTGLHSWAETWSGDNNQTYSNATLFSRDNFAKAGIVDLSKVIINVHQYFDNNFSGTQDDCLQDIYQDGFNLDAFTQYLEKNQLQAIVTEFGIGNNPERCRAPLNDFMQYLLAHSAKGKNYGFAGWTIWSSGHGWGNYNLRVKPQSPAMEVLQAYL